MSTATFRLDMQFTVGVWTNVIADVRSDRVLWTRGSTARGPIDKMAQPGLLEFALNNSQTNSARTIGYYSPGHGSCRTGFTRGIPVRLVGTFSATDYPLWRGKLRTIQPEAGTHGPRVTHCTAQDVVADLVEVQVRNIAPQVNQTEDALVLAVLGALPSSIQPPSTSIDTGLDTDPYAFDNIADGVAAWQAISDAVLSAFGWGYSLGNGTLVYENRHTRALKSSTHTFTEADLSALDVPTSVDDAFNRARVTIHPKTVDAAATTVLYEAPAPVEVAAQQTVTIWGTYRNPDNALQLIGGTAVVDGTLGLTDYSANSASDGSGSDLSASVVVTATGFASSVMFVITNAHPSASAFVTPRVRGKGIYDNAPVTVETYIAEAYGDRPIAIDLPFQNAQTTAQDLADYIANTYADHRIAASCTLHGNRSATSLTQALTRDIGDVITLSEPVTGLASMLVAIQGVEGQITGGTLLSMTWFLVPQADSPGFVLDDAALGVLDSNVLGYA